jgi:membrane protein implicated in regulation of membrane protease activity
MEWWIWFLAGLALLGVELFTPGGFYLLFFGLAAFGVGILDAAGLVVALWVQVLLFAIFSVVGILLLRRTLVVRFGRSLPAREIDSLVGEDAMALTDLDPGALGRVELRGTAWSARNTGSVPLARGRRCTVERVDGLTLWVRIAADEYLGDAGRRRSALPDGAKDERPADGIVRE